MLKNKNFIKAINGASGFLFRIPKIEEYFVPLLVQACIS